MTRLSEPARGEGTAGRRSAGAGLGLLVVALAAVSTVTVAALSGAFTGGSSSASPSGPTSCRPPALPGSVVDVTLVDMGMRGGGAMPSGAGMGAPSGAPIGPTLMSRWPAGMMHVRVSPAVAAAGPVSLRVHNAGSLVHELVVLPLGSGQRAGERAVGTDLRVDETGALGEASRTCGAGAGEGIAPGASGWTTMTLPAGRYELVCNLPGHYQAGMFAELDAR